MTWEMVHKTLFSDKLLQNNLVMWFYSYKNSYVETLVGIKSSKFIDKVVNIDDL